MMILKIAGEQVSTVKNSLVADFAMTYEIDQLKCQVITDNRPSHEASIEVYDDDIGGLVYSGTITNVQEVDINAGIWDITALDNSREMDSLLVNEEYVNESASDIAVDLLSKYAPAGFSAAGIKPGAPVIELKQFSDKRLSQCLKELCEYVGWQWYVDAHKVVHFFNAEEVLKPAPFVLDESNRNKIFDFRLSINTENIRNRIKVNGGSMLSDAQNFPFVYDGVMRAWSPPFKPHELKIYVAEVLKTVGIENIHEPSDYDFLLNYQEKRITMGSAYVSPAAGSTIRQNMRYQIPVVTVVEDLAAQKALAAITGETGDNAGVREDVIYDDTLVTLEAAEAVGNTSLRKWADPEISASFSTYTTGWEPGQLLVVNLPIRGLVNTYMVQKVNMAYRNQEWITEVQFGGRLASVADFLQALVSKQQSATAQTTTLQKFIYFNDTILISDEWLISERSDGWICGDEDAICGDVICIE